MTFVKCIDKEILKWDNNNGKFSLKFICFLLKEAKKIIEQNTSHRFEQIHDR